MATTKLVAEAVIRAVDQFSAPVKKMASSLDSFRGTAEGVSRTTGNLARSFGAFGVAQVTAFSFAVAGAVREYAQFEESMVGVKKVFAGTDAEMKKLHDRVLELSGSMPLLNTEIAELARSAVASGINKNADAVLRFVDLGAKFAKAFDISPQAAGDALASLRVALGLTIDELGALADKMNYLGNNTNTLERDLLAFMTRAAGAAANLGKQSENGVMALGSTLLSMKTEWTTASTSVTNLISRLSAGEKAVKPVRDALTELGLDAAEVAKGLATDFGGTVTDLFERIKKLPEEQRLPMLNDIAGTYGARALIKIIGNIEEYRRQLKLTSEDEKARGSVNEEYARSIDTLNSKLTILANKIGYLTKKFVEGFYEEIKYVLDSLTWAVEKFEKMPGFVKGLTAIGGGLVLLSPIILAIATGLSMLAGAAALFAANPIATGIMAMIAGLWLLMANFDAVRDAVKVAGETLIWFGGVLLQGLYDSFRMMGENIRDLVSLITGLLKPALQQTGEDLLSIFNFIANAISSTFGAAIDGVVSRVSGLLTRIQNLFGGLPASVRSWLGWTDDDAPEQATAGVRRKSEVYGPPPPTGSAPPASAGSVQPSRPDAVQPSRPDAGPRITHSEFVERLERMQRQWATVENKLRDDLYGNNNLARRGLVDPSDLQRYRNFAMDFWSRISGYSKVTAGETNDRDRESALADIRKSHEALLATVKKLSLPENHERLIRDFAPLAGSQDVNVSGQLSGKVTGKVETEITVKIPDIPGARVTGTRSSGGRLTGDAEADLNSGRSMTDTGRPQ